MKAIELVPVDAVTQLVRTVEVIGLTRYEPDRQYPWWGQHRGVGQFFSTQSEAVRFASTGIA